MIEGALHVKHQDSSRYKNKKIFKNQMTNGDPSANYQKTVGFYVLKLIVCKQKHILFSIKLLLLFIH